MSHRTAAEWSYYDVMSTPWREHACYHNYCPACSNADIVKGVNWETTQYMVQSVLVAVPTSYQLQLFYILFCCFRIWLTVSFTKLLFGVSSSKSEAFRK